MMRRWLYAHRNVPGDPARLEETLRRRIVDLLCDDAAESGIARDADGSFLVSVDTSAAGVALAKRVRVSTGVAVRAGSRVKIPLRWHADPARQVFPEFEGDIELEPLSRSRAQLTLVGSYTTPLGLLGAAVDATMLRGIVDRTAEGLLQRLAISLRRDVGELEPPPPRSTASPLRVADVMTADPLVLEEGMPVRTAALLLFHFGVSGAPVVSETGELIGVLSERDLLDKTAAHGLRLGRGAAAGHRRRRAVTVGEACSRPALVTAPEATLRAVARELIDRDVSRLVVLADSAVAGVISRHDVLEVLLRTDVAVQAAVDDALEGFGEPDVRATVQWGEVTLSGGVGRRSRISQLEGLLEEVDGVVALRGELEWEQDDIALQTYAGL